MAYFSLSLTLSSNRNRNFSEFLCFVRLICFLFCFFVSWLKKNSTKPDDHPRIECKKKKNTHNEAIMRKSNLSIKKFGSFYVWLFRSFLDQFFLKLLCNVCVCCPSVTMMMTRENPAGKISESIRIEIEVVETFFFLTMMICYFLLNQKETY